MGGNHKNDHWFVMSNHNSVKWLLFNGQKKNKKLIDIIISSKTFVRSIDILRWTKTEYFFLPANLYNMRITVQYSLWAQIEKFLTNINKSNSTICKKDNTS